MQEEIIETEIIDEEDGAEILPIDDDTGSDATTCPTELITKYLSYYKQIETQKNTADNGLNRSLNAIIEQFNQYGLSQEEKAKYIAEMYVKTTSEFDKNTSNAALQILKQEAETPLKCAQVALVDRQKQGYDESMLLKILEQQGGLASFAVNSDSDYAQDAINDLKCQMSQIQSRSQPLDDEVVCTITGAPTPVPNNLAGSNITDTSMFITWNAVPTATSYQLYMDGIEIMSGAGISYQIDGLTELTKYAFNIRATAGGNPSQLSTTVTVVTIATPIP